MKKMITTLFLAIIIVLSFNACNSEYDKYITEVKNGYLGGCFDVSVDELFKETIPNGKWDGGETDAEKMIVEYQGELSGSKVRIQFTVGNENQFKVSAIKGETVQPKDASEVAAIIESRYIQYYSYKYPDKAAADMLPNEPTENLLTGISSAYAEKAKNPIDIANYFEKAQSEIQTALNLKDDGAGTFSNSEIALMYGDSKVDNVTVKGSRIYSLFGLQTYQSIDTVSGKIGDRFEKISEEENQDGTKSVSFIRNNSEDSLIVTYAPTTSSITELTYISNGMAGYRAEQERLKKEAEAAEAAKANAEAKKSEFKAKAAGIEQYYTAQLADTYVQQEMNAASYSAYEKWDALLNEIYQYLKSTLPDDKFAALKSDEISWIAKRDSAMDAAAAEMAGGSAEMGMRYDAGVTETSERCYYLISLIQ